MEGGAGRPVPSSKLSRLSSSSLCISEIHRNCRDEKSLDMSFTVESFSIPKGQLLLPKFSWQGLL